MTLPFKMSQHFSRCMLHAVMCRMLEHASSVTSGVDICGVVDAVLIKHPEFQFDSNNDFGMLVDRVGESVTKTGWAVDELKDMYKATSDQDEYLDASLNEIAYDLAGQVITTHSILRDVIPNEVEELMSQFENLLKDRLKEDPIRLPSVKIQTWGELSDQAYRLRMWHTCQELANIFKDDQPIRSYYISAALAAADRLAIEDIPEPLVASALEQLKAALPDQINENDFRFYASVLSKEYGIRNFVAMVRLCVENGNDLDRCITIHTQIETILKLLASRATEEGVDQDLSEHLMSRLLVIEKACLLISGAFYAMALTTYSDSFILSCSENQVIVNGLRMPSFTEAGGTIEDVQAFAFYLITHVMTTSRLGWTEGRVLGMREKVNSELAMARVEAERRLQADNSVLLRSVIEHIVTIWLNENASGVGGKTPDEILQIALNRLLSHSTNPDKSLADLLTNYLVEIRNNQFLKSLKTAIYTEFKAMLSEKDDSETKIKKNVAICKAMVTVVSELLIKEYSEDLEAVS